MEGGVKTSAAYALSAEIELIAHLKLLSAFSQEEESIRRKASERLFGIQEFMIDPNTGEPIKLEKGQKFGEYHWFIYCFRAQERFSRWWIYLQEKYGEDGANGGNWFSTSTMAITDFVLPPIDILMIWHSFLLNPRDYLTDCLRAGNRRLWNMKLPWKDIDGSITCDLVYEKSPEHQAKWLVETSIPWDNIADKNEAIRMCHNCFNELIIPISCPMDFYTSYFSMKRLTHIEADSKINCLVNPTRLSVVCHNCQSTNTSADLTIGRFLFDIQRAKCETAVPLLGTYLQHDGIPRAPLANINEYFCQAGDLIRRYYLKGCSEVDLRNSVIHALRDQQSMAYLNISKKDKKKSGKRDERFKIYVRMRRMAINRVLCSYLDNYNSGEFSLSLAHAVVRQSSFANKMFKFGWLTHARLLDLMKLSIKKYGRFIELINTLPHPETENNIRGISRKLRVPTLEIDLAWHTHQLSPRNYYSYTVMATKQFVNHDDKVEQIKLDISFYYTAKDYVMAYGEAYSQCLCEFCVAYVEKERRASTSNRVKFAMKQFVSGEKNTTDLGLSQEMARSSHISAHNAIYLPAFDKDRKSDLSTRARNMWEAGAHPYNIYYYPPVISFYPACDSSGKCEPLPKGHCGACVGLPGTVCGGGLRGQCYGSCGISAQNGGCGGGGSACGGGGGTSEGSGGCGGGCGGGGGGDGGGGGS